MNKHIKYMNGYEEWLDYDENNNLIHSIDSNGHEQYHTYNDKNQCVHTYTKTHEVMYEYNENGNIISSIFHSMTQERFKELRNNSVK